MIQSLEEAQQTVLNGGVTNAEKLIEEQKEVIAKTKEELNKERVLQEESLHQRIAERRKRIAVKRSVNNSLYSDYDQPLSTSNAYFQSQIKGKDFPLRPSTTKGASGFFFKGKSNLPADCDQQLFPNEISMIDRVQGGQEQFMDDEQSFNQELMRLETQTAA